MTRRMPSWVGLVMTLIVAAVAIFFVAVRSSESSRRAGNAPGRMTVLGGCHRSLEARFASSFTRSKVANPDRDGLGQRLAPPDPTRGLICRYYPWDNGIDNVINLYRATPLSEADARLLARELGHIREPVRHIETFGCGGPGGSYDMFIFAYEGRPDVDVLYDPYGPPDGCPDFTNGFLSATGGTGLFYSYVDAIAGPVPEPTCGPGMVIGHRPAPCPPGIAVPFGPITSPTVQRVIGLSLRVAEQVLAKKGLRLHLIPASLGNARKWEIIAQSPSAGSIVFKESTVDITVAGMK